MVDSGMAHAKEYFPELLLPVSLSPQWATAVPHLCRDPPVLAGSSGSVSYGVTAPFPWVLMHTLLCVCPPRVESLFPPVLLKSCNQIPLAFKVWFSGNSSSHCQTPRLGSLTCGSELSFQWMDFCDIIVLQFVSHPPSGYGIWCYCDCAPPTILLQLLLCLWIWDIFFGEFQCLPVDDCSAVSCDSGALTRGRECTSFYSAILNLSPWTFKFIWYPIKEIYKIKAIYKITYSTQSKK